jgi:D-arabinose 1-dehydrogenase-like Zn-dependent alcohol dehydrogenase
VAPDQGRKTAASGRPGLIGVLLQRSLACKLLDETHESCCSSPGWFTGHPQIEEVEKPTAGNEEVLIKVRAAAVNPVDRLIKGPYFLRPMIGLRRPKDIRVGRDLAGEIEAVDSNVRLFRSGDAVFGTSLGVFAGMCVLAKTSWR